MSRAARTKRRPVVLYQPRDEGLCMPLGLLAVGSCLAGDESGGERAGGHVVIVDGRLEIAPEARVVGLAGDASCLGVTTRTGTPLRDALRVSAAARAANPRLTVIWGGPHATHLPRSCLETRMVDACARGAGEESFAAAVRALHAGQFLDGIPGLMVQGAGASQPAAAVEADGASPALYSLLDVERYFEARGARRLDYCSSRGSRDDRFSALPPERVLAETFELAERHRVSDVLFRDEDFFADASRAARLASALAEKPGRFGWRARARPQDVVVGGTPWLALLVRSGCRRLYVELPPDVPARGPDRDAIMEAARRLHEAGLLATFEIWLTEPGTRQSRLDAAVALARQLAALDGGFETPIRRRAPLPPALPAAEAAGPCRDAEAGVEPLGLEGWAARALAPWGDAAAERRLARVCFYFGEAQRRPGRRLGQHLLRTLSLLRVRLGFFALDIEKRAVEASAVLRTGRARRPPPPE